MRRRISSSVIRIVPSAAFIAQLVYGINAADTSEGTTMSRTAVVLSALLLLTCSASGLSQIGQQQRNRGDELAIRGKIVIGSSGDVDQRVEVRLEKTTMQMVQTTYSDSAGGFEFRSVVVRSDCCR